MTPAWRRFWHTDAPADVRGAPDARRARIWGLALAGLFLLFGVVTLDDYGITWDEEASYTAGTQNLAMIHAFFAGEELPAWFGHEIIGYQFVFDSLRSLFATHVGALLFEGSWPTAFHLFNLLLSTGAVWLLYRLILELGGSTRLAALGTLSLIASPKFLAHSQNNPKDLIGLFCFEMAVLLVVRAARRPLRSSLSAGLGLGLALASHVVSALVVPITVFWMLVMGDGPWRRRCLRLATVGAVTPLVTLLCWPWFWQDTFERMQLVLARLSRFQPMDVPVMYLGTIYPGADPPWHYSLVLLAVSTPLLLLVAMSIGCFQLRAGAPGRRVAQLALVWIAVMLISDQLAPSHYDGVRHLLPIRAPMAALAGLGLSWLWERIRQEPRTVGRPLGAVLAVAVAVMAFDLAHIHPYYRSFLNRAARAIWVDQPELTLELDTWGAAYKEGAEWLLENAEPNPVVIVPVGPQCARPYLEDRMLVYAGPPRDMVHRPTYLMFITRVSAYGPLIQYARANLEPVFSIGRGNATYLEIYRLPPGLVGR